MQTLIEQVAEAISKATDEAPYNIISSDIPDAKWFILNTEKYNIFVGLYDECENELERLNKLYVAKVAIEAVKKNCGCV